MEIITTRVPETHKEGILLDKCLQRGPTYICNKSHNSMHIHLGEITTTINPGYTLSINDNSTIRYIGVITAIWEGEATEGYAEIQEGRIETMSKQQYEEPEGWTDGDQSLAPHS